MSEGTRYDEQLRELNRGPRAARRVLRAGRAGRRQCVRPDAQRLGRRARACAATSRSRSTRRLPTTRTRRASRRRSSTRSDRAAEPLREDPGDGGGPAGDRGHDRRRALDQRHAHLLARAAPPGDGRVHPRHRAARRRRWRSLRRSSSVASYFVSRVDTEADKRLDALGRPELKGRLAVANAKLAYRNWQEAFADERWAPLEAAGASKQWCLWASTSTKNPDYRDVLYVETLIGAQTINTMPEETIVAFQDHGEVALTLEAGRRGGGAALRPAGRGGRRLRRRHGDARARRRREVLRLVRRGARRDSPEAGRAHYCLISTRASFSSGSGSVTRQSGRDTTRRTGWAGSTSRCACVQRSAGARRAWSKSHRRERVVVCGMGGSSLAPLVLGRAWRRAARGARHDAPGCSPQAGGRRRALRHLVEVGHDHGDALPLRPPLGPQPSKRPAPSSSSPIPARRSRQLAKRARHRGRCRGADDRRALLRAVGLRARPGGARRRRRRRAAGARRGDARRLPASPTAIPGSSSGLALGSGWEEGRDKVVFDNPGGFGLWLEQLIAESTGKEGQGLVPAAGESSDGADRQHVDDRHLGTGRSRRRVLSLRAGDGGRRARSSASTPSTSRTSRRRRPKTQSILDSGHVPVPGTGTGPEETVEALLAGVRPGDYIAIQAFIDPGARARARAPRRAGPRDRLRRHGGPRPALSPLDGTAAQGRAADRAFHPGRRRHWARMWPSRSGSSASGASSRRRLRETTRP